MLGVVSRLGWKFPVQQAKVVSRSPNIELFWSGMTFVPHAAILFCAGYGVLKLNRMAHSLFELRSKEEITQIFREGLDSSLHLHMMNAARGSGSSVTDMPVRVRARGMDLSLSISIEALPQFEQEGLALLFLREIEPSQLRRTHSPVKALSRGLMQEMLNRLSHPGWIIQSPYTVYFRNPNYGKMLSRCARSFLEGNGIIGQACQGCPGAEHASHSLLKEAIDQVRAIHEVVEYQVNLGGCGHWNVVMVPIDQATDVACLAVPASESTAAASLTGALVSLENPSLPLSARRAAEKLSAIEALQEARDLERNTIAREIHDALGQELTVLRLSLRRLWQGVRAHADIPAHLDAESTMIFGQLDKVVSSARRIAHELRSDGVKSQGFSSAAHSLVSNFQERLGLQGQMEVYGEWIEPDQTVGWHLYRALQELLNNIAKHAYASRFNVRVACVAGSYRLEVCDDGVGIPEAIAVAKTGIGLSSIQERAAIYQGEVNIRTRPEVPGSVVEVVIPAPVSLEVE